MENIKLVALDVDGTLIANNSWYELNMVLGITPEVDQQMFDEYCAGQLTYETWIEKIFALYQERGMATRDNISKALRERILVTDEVKKTVQDLKVKGYELAVITGSFTMVADQIADELGIERRKGNTRFIFDDDGILTALENDGEEKYAKVEHLKEFANDLQIELEQCACVGDGGNNLELFKVTKHGITFSSSSDEMKSAAWKVVDSLKDVKDVL